MKESGVPLLSATAAVIQRPQAVIRNSGGWNAKYGVGALGKQAGRLAAGSLPFSC